MEEAVKENNGLEWKPLEWIIADISYRQMIKATGLTWWGVKKVKAGEWELLPEQEARLRASGVAMQRGPGPCKGAKYRPRVKGE